MKKYISPIILLILILLLAACAGETTQTPLEPAAPTETVTQPTQLPAPTDTSASITEAVAATEIPTTEAASTTGVSFATDVMPIFEASCVKCHGVDSTKEGLDMLTYDNLLAGSRNGPVLVPGNATGSLLVELVVEGEMPNRGPKLSAEQIQILTDWVNQGALNN